MSHWLDDAARGLSEGRVTRRAVLRRGSAVAAGTLVGSLALPGWTFAQSRPCRSEQDCPTGAECCEGKCCDTAERCCDGMCVSRSESELCGNTCCDLTEGEECCDGDCCVGDEVCCGGRGRRFCSPIDKTKHCGTHCCGDGQTCCGEGCCRRTEQCCHSGKLAYCAPKGHCCGKGKHRVACGRGKHLCCPEDEHCCGGTCCKPADCHNGKCGGKCPPGQQRCFGKCGCPSDAKCCDKGDCVGATGQFVCCGVTTGSFVRAGNACCVGGKPGTLCGGVCCLQNCCGATGFEVCCEPGQGCCDANGACVACSDIRLKHNVQTLSGSRRRP